MTTQPHVLLIEDDPDIALMLSALLTRTGYQVRIAKDGFEALAALRSGEIPRVILLDLMMPNMDGYRFRSVQLEDERFAAIPTVVMTSDSKATAERLSVDACFRKPFDVAAFLAEIARHTRTSDG